jgi:hypothetical protein
MRVAPYFWGISVDGKVTAENTEVEMEADFSDLIDNLEMAGLLAVEASKGPWSVLGDFIYLGLDLDGEGPLGGDADAEVDTTILELIGLYRVAPASPFEVGLGLRYLSMDNELEVGPLSADGEGEAFDGVVAGRARWPFSERWEVALYGDVGAGDSDLTWQASGMLGYQFGDWGLGAGYRALDYDFEDGSDELDVTFSGFLLGLEYRF